MKLAQAGQSQRPGFAGICSVMQQRLKLPTCQNQLSHGHIASLCSASRGPRVGLFSLICARKLGPQQTAGFGDLRSDLREGVH